MKFLGIDYGGKRVGLALSDDSASVAFPHSVVANDKHLIAAILKVIAENNVDGGVIIGESKDFDQNDNSIMVDARKFVLELTAVLTKADKALPIEFEPEYLSSQEAVNMGGTKDRLDAHAAAVILQAYLDKRR